MAIETRVNQPKERERASRGIPATFLSKIVIFALPFAIPFLVLTGGLMYVGESMPLAIVVRMQAGDTPVLYRPSYGNQDQRYKRIAVDYREPGVVMIGSSRVLQFRAQFLDQNPDAFYNAAAPAWQLPEILRLLRGSDHRPRIIILGIDDAWFNANYEGDPTLEPSTSLFRRIFEVNRTFMQDVIDGEEFDLETLLARQEPGGSGGIALGLRAIRNGHGFRNDGSEQYGDFLVAGYLWPPHTRDMHMGWFEAGEEMYVPGNTIGETAFQRLRDILNFAQNSDMLVIGFSPPYMPSLWDRLSTSERHTYMRELQARLPELFAEYDFPYFDFHDGAALGATDEDFFDGWHHSERIALQIYINMARQVPELRAYSNLDALQQVVDSAQDTFRVFPFVAP